MAGADGVRGFRLARRGSYAIAAAALLVCLASIAVFVDQGFVRTHIGDVLVVMFMYAAMQAVFVKSPLCIAAVVFAVAVAVEVSQLVGLPELLGGPDNLIVRLTLGTVFDWKDIVMYAIGVGTAITVDNWRHRQSGHTAP